MSRTLTRSTRDGIERGIFDSNPRRFVLRKTFAHFVEFSDLYRIPGEIRIFKKNLSARLKRKVPVIFVKRHNARAVHSNRTGNLFPIASRRRESN
ncbi:hypothetical protein ACS0X5_11545 [Burkholderia gladioli]|uniref:hypothetical protein n=1 Tax=Burkholderia gladioli TaxID=28095 RepID=UPI003F79431F